MSICKNTFLGTEYRGSDIIGLVFIGFGYIIHSITVWKDAASGKILTFLNNNDDYFSDLENKIVFLGSSSLGFCA